MRRPFNFELHKYGRVAYTLLLYFSHEHAGLHKNLNEIQTTSTYLFSEFRNILLFLGLGNTTSAKYQALTS